MSVHTRTVTLLAVFLMSSLVWSAPVLVKLDFTSQEQADFAKQLGVKAYQRFDNSYIAEIESSRIPQLVKYGMSYQVLDQNPWTEKYYIASSKRGNLPALAASDWGEVLLDQPNWKLLKLSPVEKKNLKVRRLFLLEISKREIPLKFAAPQVTYLTPQKLQAQLSLLADSVSQDSLYAYNQRLQDFQTRFVVSDSCLAAANWLKGKFESFGIDSVYLSPFLYFDDVIDNTWKTGYNVVAVIKGKANPDKTIVIGGHYDSVVWNGPYPNSMMDFAPGADDNGSGTAATLEMARLVAKDSLPATTVFVCFSGEELGLWGSFDYAYEQRALDKDIQFMLNMDMIGYLPNSDKVELQRNQASVGYSNFMASLAANYGLNGISAGAGANSDHWPFMEAGYPAVFTAEYIFNFQGWHRNTDLTSYMNFEYMTRVVKLATATVEKLASSPRPVENLKIVDNGYGNGLYLSWPRNKNEADILGYFVYFGTNSNQLSSYGFFSDTSTLLSELSEGTTYYLAVSALNYDLQESPFLVIHSASSQSLPRIPSGVTAKAAFRSIDLSWKPNGEADLAGYRVYRSQISGGPFQLWAQGILDTTYTDSTNIQGGVRYYYVITAIDSSSNESAYSQEISSTAVTLDQGVLVLDEMIDILGYGDSAQDSFYSALFTDYKKAFFDYSYSFLPPPDLGTLGPYNVVVWLDDDQYDHSFLEQLELLKDYLDAGGKLFLTSWKSFEYLLGALPRTFSAGEFFYDYLKLTGAQKDTIVQDWIGAKGDPGLGYPDVALDTTKPSATWNGVLRHVATLQIRPEAEPVYFYDSKTDVPGFEGEICGLRYLGSDYDVVFLSFPLFYLDFADAQALVTKVMADFGISTSVEPEEPIISLVPKEFQLNQNYPNPFNAGTTIRYFLPEASFVKLEAFNILGQKVKILVSEQKSAGVYTVVWDGDNQAGEKVSSGIYFYRLETEKSKAIKKMVLLR